MALQPPPPPDPQAGYAPPPPMYASPAAPAVPAPKLSLNQWFRVSPWWHKALVIAPLLLIPIGGLIGGLCGGGMAAGNQAILRSRMGTPAKVWACVGVLLFGSIVFVIAEVLVAVALGQG